MTPRRAFHPDFVEHMRVHEGWPLTERIAEVVKARGRFIQQGMYTKLKNGEPGTRRQIGVIISYIRAPEQRVDRERRVLDDFLRSRGVADAASTSDAKVIEIVSVPAPPATGVGGIELYNRIFDRILFPLSYVRLFETEEQVCEAVRWMFVEAGRQTTPGRRLGTLDASLRGQERVGMRMAEYERLAASWWRRCRWTVIKVVGTRKSVGMCIMLPVKPEWYDLVRSGSKRTYECGLDDLQFPSAHLIAEGAAMKPSEVGVAEEHNPRCLDMAMICQSAWLSRVAGFGEDVPVRWLTFKGTPKNTKRALSFGFKPTGTSQRDMGIEFLERTIDLEEDDRDARVVGVIRRLQRRLEKVYGDTDCPTG
ncbi:MAG: hypothetical protein KF745_02835 [Phycisphaeraceae bacterium]|nr:hypothetical protein [Phycisphaeraceae bacterium]